jgi:hypothetical protein
MVSRKDEHGVDEHGMDDERRRPPVAPKGAEREFALRGVGSRSAPSGAMLSSRGAP